MNNFLDFQIVQTLTIAGKFGWNDAATVDEDWTECFEWGAYRNESERDVEGRQEMQ